MQLTFPCRILLGLTIVCAPFSQAQAQAYPERPVRLVIPFPAGTTTDLMGRRVAEALAKDLKQPVVIDNRAGAGGNIAAEYVSKQAADGYTVFMGTTANMAANKTLFKLGYDPVQDFTPLSMGYYSCNLLVVNPEWKIRTLPDLIAEAKANPGKLNYGSSGVGTAGHLAAEWFKTMTGTDITHIPFKGGPQILTELMAGRVEMSFEAVGNALPLIRTGKLRPLATTCKERLAAFPNVPTMLESGVKDFDIRGWTMFVAPARLPDAISRRLSTAFFAALSQADVRESIGAGGMEASPMTPAATAAFLQEEIDRWARMIRAANIPQQ